MIVFKKAEALSQYLSQQKISGHNIGFVPTMGALHQGHLSLINASKGYNEITVCSIFINPTQFTNAEDFKHYPVSIEEDINKLLATECDILFLPSVQEIYPVNYQNKVYDLGNLEEVLEGHYRPGHFQGVCQVVDRLLEIVQPSNLYLGAKDYQQCKVITRLILLMGKQDEITIHIEPTFREEDGLAMSSRNLRLTALQRTIAAGIFEALSYIKDNYKNVATHSLEQTATDLLNAKGFKVDYFQIADAETLQPPTEQTMHQIALVAAYLDDIRLIDNLPLN